MTRVGMTVRPQLRPAIREARRQGLIRAVEIVPSPFFQARMLDELKARLLEFELPYAFHLVDSSMLSADFPQPGVLEDRAEALRDFDPILLSDHFTAHRLGDLDFAANLPPIATPEVHPVYRENLRAWLDAWPLPRERLCVEHVPTLFRHRASSEDALETFVRLAIETPFNILLDLHNLYVDERAGLCDADAILETIPPALVREIHVAGGKSLAGGTYVDGHCADVPARVFELLARALQRCRPELVILEREQEFADQRGILSDLERINELVAAHVRPR